MNTENKFSNEKIQNNRLAYLERLALYKKFGFDHEAAREKIILHLPNTLDSILEIGTGKGYLTTMLAHSFKKVVTVDIESDEQKIAGLNAAYYDLDNIEFVLSDAGKLNYPDKAFDAVVSAFTFHHLESPFKVLSEMIRLAAKQILISDFTRKGFEIIDKVHLYNGKKHEARTDYFDIIGVYLKEFNFNVQIFESEYQMIFSAARIQQEN